MIFNFSTFGLVTEEDLYASLQEAADENGVVLPFPVSSIMFTWTLQSGYPVINVARSGTTVTISQVIFII